MDKDRIRSFADKVYGEMAGAMTMGMAFIGTSKGLFRAMSGKGAMTSEEVASITATATPLCRGMAAWHDGGGLPGLRRKRRNVHASG